MEVQDAVVRFSGAVLAVGAAGDDTSAAEQRRSAIVAWAARWSRRTVMPGWQHPEVIFAAEPS